MIEVFKILQGYCNIINNTGFLQQPGIPGNLEKAWNIQTSKKTWKLRGI